MFVQLRVPSFMIRFKQQQFALIVVILYTSFAYTITIVQSIFIRKIFKPQLFSSHAMGLHTRLTEFFLNLLLALSCLLYNRLKQSHECSCKGMSLPSRNLYKCKQVTCSVVVVCLLVYPLFLYCIVMLPIYFLIPLFLSWCCCYTCVYSLIM